MKKLTEKEIDERLAKDNPNIVRIGPYKGTMKPMRVKCLPCEYKWSPLPNNIFRGHGCPKCGISSKVLTEKEVSERLQKHFPNIILIGKYERWIVKTEFKNKKCGHTWRTTLKNIFHGRDCPKCAIVSRSLSQTLTEKEVDKKLRKYFPNIIRIGPCKGSKIPMRVRNKICNHEWSSRPNNIFFGHGCPKCNESKGEKETDRVLDFLKTKNTRQKRFDGCRNPKTGYRLPFDFYLPKLNICIEFDGIQHYKPQYWRYKTKKQAENAFKRGQHRDSLKTKFCKKQGIRLLRIKYTQINNIEPIIKKFLGIK